MGLIIEHPYRALRGGHWLRGNLHTHTTRSDGSDAPQVVLDRYAQAGYDFLAITDHDLPAVARDYRAWNARGLILIPGNEITAHGPHMLHINLRRRIEPRALRQQVILDANRDGGFVVVNHPNWGEDFDHCSIARLREWVGFAGIEIFNGTIHRLHGSTLATNKWDMLLGAGRRVWGFANDDLHHPDDFAQGWNMVYAQRRSGGSIVEALMAGRFYASTGLVINAIDVRGGSIRVQAAGARRMVAVGAVGRRLAMVDGDTFTYQPDGQSPYVRVECYGDGEAAAWTQPFFIRARA
jgi:hypothetical protein